ncbi:hypothetical protein Cni_G06866 [Canna indica]|uniref:Uncharacterized protein n=1 Tax=Canna indica TaxID=4628 RepID=A0AAQ3K155_9LILI|nr:hypothetical protein Cni_G06866 [Canna indica]
MEGVGARLGRSSTRYGPATVFSGPVRKWKKRWIPLATPNNNNSSASANGNANGARSHLLLYKWAPISSATANGAAQPEEPPPRKFRYVPIAVVEEQTQEAAEKLDDQKLSEDDPSSLPNHDSSDMKPDMNDVAIEEAQASEKEQISTDDNNLTNLDLNLGLKSTDSERETKPRDADQDEGENQPGKSSLGVGIEMKTTTNSQVQNKLKRKASTTDLEMRV